MIVDLTRDDSADRFANQMQGEVAFNQRSVGMQVGASQDDAQRQMILARDVAHYQQREAFAEEARVRQGIKNDALRREGLQRSAARGIRSASEVGLTFDKKSLDKMLETLLGDEEFAPSVSHLIDAYDGMEMPDGVDALSSPEMGEFFTDISTVYGQQQMRRGAEVKASGLESMAPLFGDARFGLSAKEEKDLQGLVADKNVGPEQFTTAIKGLRDKAAANLGFFEAKQSLLREVNQVWDQVRPMFGAGGALSQSDDILGGGGSKTTSEDLLYLRGALEMAATPEEAFKARSQFLVKAYGLDNVITEAEDLAYSAGMEEARTASQTAQDQFNAQFGVQGGGQQQPQGQPGAQPQGGQQPAGPPMPSPVMDTAAELGIELPQEYGTLPLSQQVLVTDALRSGVDPEDGKAFAQFIEDERKINKHYGKTPTQAAQDELTELGLEPRYVQQFEHFTNAGLSPQKAFEVVATRARDEQMAARRSAAVNMTPMFKGVAEAWAGRKLTDEDVARSIAENGAFNMVADGAEAAAEATLATKDAVVGAAKRVNDVVERMDNVINELLKPKHMERREMEDGSVRWKQSMPGAVQKLGHWQSAWLKEKTPDGRDAIRFSAESEVWGVQGDGKRLSPFQQAYMAEHLRHYLQPAEDNETAGAIVEEFFDAWAPELNEKGRALILEGVRSGLRVTPKIRDADLGRKR